MWTEWQIEAWLGSVTRTLQRPDGRPLEHTAFRLVWEQHDFLVEEVGYASEELVAFALEEVELQGVDFAKAFDAVVGHIHQRVVRHLKAVF